ncbi:Murein hydrolase activator NlpD precursor [Microbacterium oxydans]|uniref:Murein hydrolase activator NlpD n=1 Tax=Microbacterium oxydans TaxID=82380 RepID=A0A0F0KZD2_9MICO|nr:VCBS repeat domain-containing M23 family metallopeptidase [Microbacterium oxydans]KJL25475.1 Murein hydrolase activator NlpD precursor [Microbacterium oxydans]
MSLLKRTPRTSNPPASRRLLAAAGTALAIAIGTLVPVSPASAASGFVQPVSGHVADIVDGCPGGTRPTHEGVDINGNGGTPVYASAAGKVTTAINSNATTGYGTQIVISHANGYSTRYAHMVNGSLTVSNGATVAQGQRIGTVGSTGNSTGAHMHFEIYRNGSNITNQYYSCYQGTVTALQYLGTGPIGTSGLNADYNGDGKADVLAVSTTGQMTAYNGNGNGGWNPVTLGPGWDTTRILIHGDYNGDGHGDIVAVRDDGTLWFYRGGGNNTFQASQVGHGWGTFRLVTGGADFNSDGAADLVAIGSDENLYLYAGNGAGGFNAAVQIGNGWGAVDMILAGDFGTDGKGDILARDTSGALRLYPGNGATLNAPSQVGNGWSGMTAITGGADMGTDGYADVLARDAAGDLWLYPGLGGSGFGAPLKVGNGWNGHRLIV